MIRILANDGLEEGALFSLQEHGFDVIIEKVPQENLIDFINSPKFEVSWSVLLPKSEKRFSTLVRTYLLSAVVG